MRRGASIGALHISKEREYHSAQEELMAKGQNQRKEVKKPKKDKKK